MIERASFVGGCLAALFACAPEAAPRTAPSPARPAFDAARLETGRFRYRTTLRGEDAGGSLISVTRVDAQRYQFRNEVSGAFRQTWEATATDAMVPIHAELGLGAEDNKSATMQLTYRGFAVTGTATRTSAAGTRSGEVAAELPADIVDQRIDWAALMAAPLAPGATVRFAVYDPWTAISPVVAEVAGAEEIEVPAGRFTVLQVTYRIQEREKGPRTYVIWVTEAVPRALIREDFPNGATTQLVERVR